MQFIPETATAVGSALGMRNLPLEKLYDPAVNIQLGAYYWKSLLSELRRPEMALAAYNGGMDNVRRWRAKGPDTDEFFVADIGFVETKRYVMEVFKARAAYQALGRQ
jgi:soluble lytic murein transglycosylase